MGSRRRLSDILPNGNGFAERWKKAQPAEEYSTLPDGEYDCRIMRGELINAKTGTPGFKLTFQIFEGHFAGRRIWHDLWLTDAALPMTKRDLAKIGIIEESQLNEPIPPGILVRVKLSLRTEEDGTERNRVRRFDFLGIEERDPFAPDDGGKDGEA